MTCREFTSFIADYLAGDLTSEVRAAFERHLTRCDNCVQYLADYRRTLDLEQLVLSGDDDVPDEVPEGLVSAILAARRSSSG
jgi:anti-sigma factor RsiW